ncbi:MAG: argininosuccinate lyase [Coriobacteriia bacterium]
MAQEKKAWGGRFDKPLDGFIEEFGASLPIDRRMWEEDVRGSIAHVRMLAAQGIVGAEDASRIEDGLDAIGCAIRDDSFVFDLGDEDIHMSIERALIDKVGAVGGKLHTARSRNDQVALDARMHSRSAAVSLARACLALQGTLLARAEEHLGAVMPGYTHLQKAQPVLLSHHLLAYVWMLARDFSRVRHAYDAADAMPLGAAALAGTPFPIDRAAVASTLGFASVVPNSMDAVSDRDFLLDLTYACALAMVHLSRLCEEIVLWSSEEFGFVSLDDAYATGSSIMPQKKNPDVAELTRGKTGRVVGDLTALLVTLKALPLAYNKDMQEDKEAAFDASDTLRDCLRAVRGMVETMTFDVSRMRSASLGGFMAATDLADHLAARGMPFREAHEIVGGVVLACEREGRTLQDLTLEELRAASPAFGDDVLSALDIDAVVARRTSEGGTGHDRVREQIDAVRGVLRLEAEWLDGVTG